MDAARVEACFVTVAGEVVQQRLGRAAGQVRFEELGPVAAFPVVPGRSWGPGWWWSSTTGRLVAHGSMAMRMQLMLLDRERSVTGLAGRPVRLLWREDDGTVRSWVPQLFARYADGGALLADCPAVPGAGGPAAQRAARVLARVCEGVGWVYRRLDPPSPVVAANVRWLAGYRHPRFGADGVLREAVLAAFARPRALAEGVAAVGVPLRAGPMVFHLLWSGALSAELADRPLDAGTVVGRGVAA
ncbi:TnsA-like heteromeric transposase endonuclease subunit [Kitasatospora sp. NPDC004615]|uniref:TnsA-like heteromeric transposase endonuclease subunit n=1 Tax=Kitasatospora sp. NPDC004615 TaxID=3364017 RepID=UPI0036936719